MITELQAAKQKILDWLASGKFLKQRMRVDGDEVEYTTPDQAVNLIRRLDALIAEESGTVATRTYAKNGGRG